MSQMERNKGKLVPFTLGEHYVKQFLQSCGVEFDNNLPYQEQYDEYVDEDESVLKLDGVYYEIQWEVEQDQDSYGFADVKRNKDGSIDFHTYHYNGGAHWIEVVQEALE